MSGKYLSILRGDDYTFSTMVNVNGVTQNIAGASLWFTANGSIDFDASNGTYINASTNTGQITIVNNNTISMNLNAAFTQNLAQANVLYWALKMQTSAGANYTIDRGRAAILDPIINS